MSDNLGDPTTNIHPASWEDLFKDFTGLFSEINEISFFEVENQGLISTRVRPRMDLFGYSLQDVEKGLNVLQLIVPEQHEKLISSLNKVLETIVEEDREFTGLRKDKTTFPMLVYSKPIFENGKMIGRRGVIIDISERKQAEDEYNQMLIDKNNEMEDFMAAMTHDMKSPLSAISGFVDLIFLEKKNLDPDTSIYLRHILSNTEKMIRIMEDVLQYSRLGVITEEESVCSLNDILNRILNELHPRIKSLKIQIHVDPKLPKVIGVENQLCRLFGNLLDNAIKYMDLNRPNKEIHVGIADKTSEFVTLFVQDNGIGIAEKDISKLFRVFTRIRNSATQNIQGTGLGLANVKKIVEIHSGKIWAVSTENQGTTFYFSLRLT
ncbi:MAG: sensor histidine kinase [Candidatus Hodarchaeales archaeon]